MLAAEYSQAATDIVRPIDNGAASVGAYDFGTEDRLVDWIAAVPNGVIPGGQTIIVGLCNATIEFNDVVLRNEESAVQVRRVLVSESGVSHHEIGEGVRFELIEEVCSLRAGQVVQTIAKLQIFHLRLEHVVEGRAQHATELWRLLAQSADPEIDGVKTAEGSGRCNSTSVVIRSIQKLNAVSRCSSSTQDDQCGRCTLASERSLTGDSLVRAISRDEVYDRARIFKILGKVDPARVRRQVGEAGVVVELRPSLVKRRDAGFTAAGQVERRQVQRQPQQIGAHVLNDEFVHRIAHVAR